MAEVNLGNDTSLNVSLGEQTNLSTTVYDINYIPDYVKAEQERRTNETIRIANEEERQDNEQDRIALYEDLENKLETDYWRGEKGDTGLTPSITANASITGGTGTPSVSVSKSGTDENPVLSFAFENLKGDKGDAGAVKFLIVQTLPTEDIEEDTIYLVPINPDEEDNNYEEYIYVNGEWELLGKISVQVDLTDYVKNTDYAGSGNNKGGTVVLKTTYNVDTNASGVLYCFNKTYSQYGSMDNSSFISKGTLENVITGKGLVNNIDTATVSGNGTSILLNDSINAPFNKFDLKGNTSQTGTPTPSSPIPINVVSGDNTIYVVGKNLYEGSQDFSGTWNNSNYWTTDNETYNSLVVKKRDGQWSGISKDIKVESGKTYYFSLYAKSDTSRTVAIYLSGGTATITPSVSQFNTTTSWQRYSIRFTCSVSGTIRARLENTTSSSNNYTYICGYQLEESDSLTTYEPYIGSSYPIYLGVENLFNIYINKSSGYTRTLNGITEKYNDDGSITYTGTATAQTDFYITDNGYPSTDTIITLDTSKKYTLSLTGNTGTNIRWSVGYGTTAYHCNTTSTFTPTTNISWSFIRISNGATINATIYPQLEIGSKANHFTPYGTTPIELCKIGNYQDYIYKDNGSWYLHKEIGKVVLDGTETGWSYQSNNKRFYRYFTDLKNNGEVNASDTYCNCFTPSDTLNIPYTIVHWSNALFFYSGDMFSSLSEVTTWLGTNKPIVYYPLANSTAYEITDTTLIEQLEAIKSANSYEGQTNISQENNDLPFILNIEAFTDTYNGRYQSLVKTIELMKEE